MTQNDFKEELKKINISPTDKQLQDLEEYYNILVEWNKHMNLTGITVKEDVYLKHFYDSATINKAIDLTRIETLCDVGTGAGFPGLVLKILFPNLRVTLVDSLNKRIKFLNHVIEQLQLTEIETICVRAEEYAKDTREKYDVVTARAVAPLSILLECISPLAKINGYIIPMKADVTNELQNLSKIEDELKIKLKIKEEFSLPFENSKRTILYFIKKEKSPGKYPRKYSDIKKRPL